MQKKTISGKGKGRILVMAGIHGDEITPIWTIAAMALSDEYLLSMRHQFETLTLVNFANPLALREKKRAHTNPVSTNDANRIFSVGLSETVTFNLMKTELEKLIEEHDIIIDIHSSPIVLNEFVLIDANKEGIWYTDFCESNNIPWVTRTVNINTTKAYAIQKGKKAFTVELNAMEKTDIKSVEKGMPLIYDIIQGMGRHKRYFLDKIIDDIGEFLYQDYISVKSKYEGLLMLKKGIKYVRRGESIGEICDGLGKHVGNLYAPCNGFIFQGCHGTYISTGDDAAYIQPTGKIKNS